MGLPCISFFFFFTESHVGQAGLISTVELWVAITPGPLTSTFQVLGPQAHSTPSAQPYTPSLHSATRAEEGAQLVKGLPCKPGHPSSLHSTCLNSWALWHMLIVSVLGKQRQKVPGAHWPANVADLASPRPVRLKKKEKVDR